MGFHSLSNNLTSQDVDFLITYDSITDTSPPYTGLQSIFTRTHTAGISPHLFSQYKTSVGSRIIRAPTSESRHQLACANGWHGVSVSLPFFSAKFFLSFKYG
jgi:hypothetical protein